MMILGTALADLFHGQGQSKKSFPWISLAVLTIGVATAFLLPVSKHRVSASYVLISLGISALLFISFHWMVERFT
jgi:predicted acyltransferase